MSKEPTYEEYIGEAHDIEKIRAEEKANMSLIGHLEELRYRIIKILIAAVIGAGIGYFFIEPIVAFITAPATVPAGKLYYMRPAEAFFIYIKVALISGVLIASPVIFYQVWAFFLPALTVKEKAVLGFIVPISVLLFFGGMAFAYFVVLPIGIKFFLGFATESLQPMLSMESYVDFVIMFLLPFGLIFELPLVIIILSKIGLITSALLKRSRRYVIFGIFVFAAILTPPDVVSQTLMAVPMLLLYEISYLIVKYVLKK